MQYVGGKKSIARDIVYAIERYRHGRSVWIEPFVGGGAVLAVAARYYRTCYAYDIHPDLILMYQALQSGWQPPAEVSEAEYQALRYAEPSALRGFAGFGCSFGGKWFRGYARGNSSKYTGYAAAARKSLIQMRLSGTTIAQTSFFDINWSQFNPHDSIIYCDPPYANTQGYSVGEFDHARFWEQCERLHAQGFLVAVSEYDAPESWPCIWHKEMPLQLSGGAKKTNRLDRLFMPSLVTTPYYMELRSEALDQAIADLAQLPLALLEFAS